jgi:predicted deacylase
MPMKYPVSLQLRPPFFGIKSKFIRSKLLLTTYQSAGLLVSHHLIKLLDGAAARGEILEKIVVVPYANPIGLSQHPMGTHIGRFSLETGVNFNRQFADVTNFAISRIEGRLKRDDEAYNVKIIRDAFKAAIEEVEVFREEAAMKKFLYSLACDADVALDLHCDQDAVLHMYTHDHLWPLLSDLAAELGTECQLLAPEAGGNPFDEALSCPWANIRDKVMY